MSICAVGGLIIEKEKSTRIDYHLLFGGRIAYARPRLMHSVGRRQTEPKWQKLWRKDLTLKWIVNDGHEFIDIAFI